MAPIGVLVVDDNLAVRAGLARLLCSAPLVLRYVRTVATADEALSAAARLQPDVVILDVDLAGEDGLTLIPQLALGARVLVLTSQSDAATRARARRLGACAFVDKSQPAAELLKAISDLCRGTAQEGGEISPLLMAATSDVKSFLSS